MKISNKIKVMTLTSALLCSPLSFAATDSDITSGIKAKFIADKTTSDLDVSVSSHDGVVKLAGNVNTDAEADKLIQLAGATQGVNDVETSQLHVKTSKHKIADTTITAKIKGLYVREKLFGDRDISITGINVETTNGIVYLIGTVDSQAEADNAVKLAKSIHGVESVNSKLSVKSTN